MTSLSELPPPQPPIFGPLPQVEPTDAEALARRREFIADLSTSVAVVAAWFTVLALVAALIWVKVTPLPEFTRTATNGSMDEEQLARQFATNGWFLVIAGASGLISGLVLLLLRRRSPVVMVALVAAGGGLATLIMLQCGLAWGPGDPNVALGLAKFGQKVPVRLKPDVHAVYYIWSLTAMVGAVVALWILESVANRRARLNPAPQYPNHSDYSR
jgi:hypothetical protein